MLPVLLYVFDLRHNGWYWQHAALFAAMTASTDAVAVGAILKSGTALCVALFDCEGSSLCVDLAVKNLAALNPEQHQDLTLASTLSSIEGNEQQCSMQQIDRARFVSFPC